MSNEPAGEQDHQAPSKRVVVAGGSGLIGRALAASLVRDGQAVDVLSRNPAGRSRHVPAGARLIGWNPADQASLNELARALAGAHAVVNLSGVPAGPRPWTPGRRRELYRSRVDATQALVAALGRMDPHERPAVLVNAAGIDGYTGLDTQPATEATNTSGTPGFLASLGRDWEAAAARATTLGVRVVMVRTAFVLARESNLMRLLALPVRLGLGGRYGSGEQWFSWIHIDDLVAVYRRAIDDPDLVGPIIAASPAPCRQRDLAVALGRVLHRPTWLPVPAWLLRLVLGGQSTLLLDSRRVRPAGLDTLGFAFRYRDLEAAIRDVLDRPD